MRTRRFENTLREREAVAGGARCRSLGFYSDALPHCLCAPVPARPSGEQPGARGQGPGPPGARDSARGRRPPVRGPGVQGRPELFCVPQGPGHRAAEKQGLGAERGSAEAGVRGLLKRVK